MDDRSVVEAAFSSGTYMYNEGTCITYMCMTTEVYVHVTTCISYHITVSIHVHVHVHAYHITVYMYMYMYMYKGTCDF